MLWYRNNISSPLPPKLAGQEAVNLSIRKKEYIVRDLKALESLSYHLNLTMIAHKKKQTIHVWAWLSSNTSVGHKGAPNGNESLRGCYLCVLNWLLPFVFLEKKWRVCLHDKLTNVFVFFLLKESKMVKIGNLKVFRKTS